MRECGPRTMCQMSDVTCDMSFVKSRHLKKKVFELIIGVSVINGAYPSVPKYSILSGSIFHTFDKALLRIFSLQMDNQIY